MKTIDVNLGENSYPVIIGKNIFGNLTKTANENKLFKKVFFIADKKMYTAHKYLIDKEYTKFENKKNFMLFEASEKNKSFKSVQSFLGEMLIAGYGRDSLLIAAGGGIAGDIAGFTASIFARGIQFVQIPTTLLAMVDSSVGGKTGINFGHTKNIVGSFYQPKLVLIDTEFLKTLPEDEIICGLGEVVKYGLLIDDDFYFSIKKNLNKILNLDTNLITNIISECVKFKAGIVEKDEKEKKGLRKILNLGHTFAHAIEVDQKHKIKHGQAVIVGLACALHLSNKIGLLDDKSLAEYLSLIVLFTGKIKINNLNIPRCYEIMRRDKKNKDDKIKFVLLSGAGKLIIDVEANKEDVFYALNNGIQYFID